MERQHIANIGTCPCRWCDKIAAVRKDNQNKLFLFCANCKIVRALGPIAQDYILNNATMFTGENKVGPEWIINDWSYAKTRIMGEAKKRYGKDVTVGAVASTDAVLPEQPGEKTGGKTTKKRKRTTPGSHSKTKGGEKKEPTTGFDFLD